MAAKRKDGYLTNLAQTPAGHDRQDATGASPSSIETGAGFRNLPAVPADRLAPPGELSVRAENVLKELAAELTGENPPRGRWSPSDKLLGRLTFKDISTARNCGPQTIAEIIRWAQTRGKTIQPSSRTRRSLSAMWQDVIARFSSGEISKAEVAEALENSARRRNTRIPVEFQKMLLQLVNSSGK